MSDTSTREPTLSVRLLWPFLRVASACGDAFDVLSSHGLALSELADPNARISHSTAMALLEHAVARNRDPGLGLRASEHLEPGDFGALEYAARCAPSLRGAIESCVRFLHLMNGAAEPSLHETGNQAIWRFRSLDGLSVPPAANDYELSCVLQMTRRDQLLMPDQVEVHLAHTTPTDAEAYARVFGPRVRLGMPHNALVFSRSLLDQPVPQANPLMQSAFEAHAETLLRGLDKPTDMVSQVREVLRHKLRAGEPSMLSVARAIGMSASTLRRRLAEEGTNHTELLEELRRELAQQYLRDESLSIGEIAYLLGFSHVTAFYKAFRRWEREVTPADFRRRALSEPPAALHSHTTQLSGSASASAAR